MRRCSRCSPTANRGRAPRSRWHSDGVSAPCSARSMRWPRRGKCSGSAARARGAGPRRPCRDSRQPCCSPLRCRLNENRLMRKAKAEVIREYGPFPGIDKVAGVTFDGKQVWFATGDAVKSLDPSSGEVTRSIDVAAHAGTAFDGTHLFQLAEDRIQKIEPSTGQVVATIPAPGRGGDSGLTWAEGTLWVGHYRERKIHQIDPETGAILRTIESNRFVTGVTWVDGELWHATWEGSESELRRVDPESGEVIEQLETPVGINVSGLESDGGDQFFCGGGGTGKVRAVRRAKYPPPFEREPQDRRAALPI